MVIGRQRLILRSENRHIQPQKRSQILLSAVQVYCCINPSSCYHLPAIPLLMAEPLRDIHIQLRYCCKLKLPQTLLDHEYHANS